MYLQFNVNSIPVAQPRQRHRIITSGNNSYVGNYTPTKHPVNAFKAACQAAATEAYKEAPLDCPLGIVIRAVFPRPANKMWKTREMPREYKTSKPDFDNLAKSVCDALTGLIWRDDACLVDVRVIKEIASGYEQPKVEIAIGTI